MSLFNCSRIKNVVVHTIDDTVLINRIGEDQWRVKFVGMDGQGEIYTSSEVENLFKEE